jgi:uncharacterized protein (TIGR04255 family)
MSSPHLGVLELCIAPRKEVPVPLQVPAQRRRFYRSPRLKLVVCQVKFPVLLNFEQPGLLGAFQEAVADVYPRPQLEQQVGLTLSPAGAAPIPPTQLWRFRDPDEVWSLVLARDFLSLETTAYTRFEDFHERLQRALEALERLPVTYRERLGVRYINEFRHQEAASPSAWRGYLNNELLGMVGGEVLGEDVIHAVEDIRVRQEDGVLALRHGYVGPEPTGDDPHYLLDLDYFDETGRPFDRQQTLDQVDAFHRRIHDVFELSITDSMRELLGVEEQSDA